jgi:putative tryptophan/tyrosine transport system substrate-binding protein
LRFSAALRPRGRSRRARSSAERVARVGVLWPGAPPDKWDEAFRQGLRTHDYVEGRNILLEYRWAEGNQERFPVLAQELARLPLDVIVTISARAILAVKEATTTIPIVFAGTSDPVRTGFAASLARPGGNPTGLSNEQDPRKAGRGKARE